MIVYRIGKWKYLDDLSGTGARLYGGRWNQVGTEMLYTSTHLSLAVLELLANNIRRLVDDTYGYISLEIPDDCKVEAISPSDLQADWRAAQYSDQTTQIGSQWASSKTSLALMVPSAVLHQENNVLINSNHEDFSLITVKNKGRLELDRRVTA